MSIGRVPIPSLLYHDVADEVTSGGEPWTVSRSAFLEQLALISASGRPVLSITDLAAGLSGVAELPEAPIVVSFDDGYASWPWVADAMSSARLNSATMYVTTGFLDRPGYLESNQLKALPAWVDVGAHSVTHRRLDELKSATMAIEIRDSKDSVEQLAGRRCYSFAYPHGNYDSRAKRMLAAAGLTSGAAVRNAMSHTGDDIWALSRLTVTAETSVKQFADYLEGRGAPIGWVSERMQTRGFRYARRCARALGKS